MTANIFLHRGSRSNPAKTRDLNVASRIMFLLSIQTATDSDAMYVVIKTTTGKKG